MAEKLVLVVVLVVAVAEAVAEGEVASNVDSGAPKATLAAALKEGRFLAMVGMVGEREVGEGAHPPAWSTRWALVGGKALVGEARVLGVAGEVQRPSAGTSSSSSSPSSSPSSSSSSASSAACAA